MSPEIAMFNATGAEITKIVADMQKVLIGKPEHHIMMACLSIILVLQKTGMTSLQLAKAVRDISEYIAVYLSNLDEPTDPTDLARMN